MKFYSQITSKPNSVIKETKDGSKLVGSQLICTFINGELETEDPEVIEYLEKHPDKFRTDGPWPKPNRWQETKEGKDLLKRGEKLGIDIRHIRKNYLINLIREKEQEVNLGKQKPDREPETKEKELSYQETVARAKELGIPTHKRKKAEILEDLKQKEVV